MNEILNWFTDNYKQDKNECIAILTQAQKDYPFTIEDIKVGCTELRKIPLEDQDHLPTHIKILGELSNVGINANIAGEKLRESLLKSKKG
jgi:hypothetical protein